MRILTFFILLVSVNTIAQAQSSVQKTGYADWNYIFSQMPEYKQVESELKTHGAQLDNQLQAKYNDYEAKLKAYQEEGATMVDAVKIDREQELSQLQQNIQRFQQDAQASIQKKQDQLMEPIFATVGKAIEDIAKEHGYSFILNPQLIGGGDIILYSDEKYNISELVLKKIGITPKPATN